MATTFTQRRFDNMKHLKPPRPTVRDENVALKIARRIVEAVNLDDFYWEPDEIEDRVFDVQQEIMLAGNPKMVFSRLEKKPIDFIGMYGHQPYGWEGINDHCWHIGDEIEVEEVNAAILEHEKRYG